METKNMYEQIEKANKEIQTVKLGNKGYAQVNERIKAFRKVYPTGKILTNIEDVTEKSVRFKAEIFNESNEIISTGYASEKITGDSKKDHINIISMIENCETSAVGRALGFAGFGVDTSIASAEDMEKTREKQKLFEIHENMFITEEDAKNIIKVVIGELMRKMGVVKASLEQVVQEQLWTKLEDMNINQLMKLEGKLRTLNMESNDWHELYNENSKIKDVVPVNQEVTIDSYWKKFGEIALERAKDDAILRNEIIDSYLNMGINLADN